MKRLLQLIGLSKDEKPSVPSAHGTPVEKLVAANATMRSAHLKATLTSELCAESLDCGPEVQFYAITRAVEAQLELVREQMALIKSMPFNSLCPTAVQFAELVNAPIDVREDIVSLGNWCRANDRLEPFLDLIAQLGKLMEAIEVERNRLLKIFGAATEFHLQKEDIQVFYYRLRLFIEDNQTYVMYKHP